MLWPTLTIPSSEFPQSPAFGFILYTPGFLVVLRMMVCPTFQAYAGVCFVIVTSASQVSGIMPGASDTSLMSPLFLSHL